MAGRLHARMYDLTLGQVRSEGWSIIQTTGPKAFTLVGFSDRPLFPSRVHMYNYNFNIIYLQITIISEIYISIQNL